MAPRASVQSRIHDSFPAAISARIFAVWRVFLDEDVIQLVRALRFQPVGAGQRMPGIHASDRRLHAVHGQGRRTIEQVALMETSCESSWATAVTVTRLGVSVTSTVTTSSLRMLGWMNQPGPSTFCPTSVTETVPGSSPSRGSRSTQFLAIGQPQSERGLAALAIRRARTSASAGSSKWLTPGLSVRLK